MRRRSLLLNFLSLTTARVLTRFTTAATALVIVRHLGKAGFGVYSEAFAFASIAVALTEPGLRQVVIRSGARASQGLPALLGNALLTKGALLVVGFAAMLGASTLLGHDPTLRLTIALLGTALFVLSLQDVFFALFQSAERMHLTGGFQATTALASLGGVATVVALGGGLYAIAGVQAAVALAVLPAVIWFGVRQTRPRPRPREVGGLLREGFPFGLSNLLFLLNAQASIVIMGHLFSEAEVGVYSAPYKLVATLYTVPSIVTWVVAPRLYRYGAKQGGRHTEMSRTVLRWLSVFGFGTAGLLFLTAGPVVHLLFGDTFAESASLLRILAWLIALQCVSAPLGDALTTSDRHGLRVGIMGTTIALGLTAYVVVLPRTGIGGAPWVLLGTETALLVAYAVAVRFVIPGYHLFRALRSQLLGLAVAMALGVFVVGPAPTGWGPSILGAAIFAAAALALLFLFGFLEPFERAALSRLVHRRGASPSEPSAPEEVP